MTDKGRENIRKALLKRFEDPEERRKLSIAKLGKHYSKMSERNKILWANPEYREHMSLVHKGKTSYLVGLEKMIAFSKSKVGRLLSGKRLKKIRLSEEYILKVKRGIKRGAESPNWIKDRSTLAKRQERNDMAYKEWRRLVKERDENVCRLKDENCEGYMIAAHIKGWAAYPELRYEVNNGITLCQGHHPRTRSEDQRLMPVFQELVGSVN